MSFVNLPIPVSVGPATSVSISDLSAQKTLVVEGDVGSNILILEGSHDDVNFVPILQVTQYNDPGTITFNSVWKSLRLNLFSGRPPSTASIGGELAANSFATLDDVGVDTSLFGGNQTLAIFGRYTGLIAVEGSDNGTDFNPSPIAFFNAGGPDFRTISGAYKKMRFRRLSGSGAVVVTLGATAVGGSGTEGESFSVSDDGSNYVGTNLQSERVVREWYADFSVLQTAFMQVEMLYVGKRDAGTAATLPFVRLRIGGVAPGVVGGTQVGAATALSNTADTLDTISGVIAVPAGPAKVLVQATMIGGITTDEVPVQLQGFIRAMVVEFTEMAGP